MKFKDRKSFIFPNLFFALFDTVFFSIFLSAISMLNFIDDYTYWALLSLYYANSVLKKAEYDYHEHKIGVLTDEIDNLKDKTKNL